MKSSKSSMRQASQNVWQGFVRWGLLKGRNVECEGFGFEPVKQYPHLRGALFRKVISKDKFLGSVAVYLVVLNKLKVCAINTPLLLLSAGEKMKEFANGL